MVNRYLLKWDRYHYGRWGGVLDCDDDNGTKGEEVGCKIAKILTVNSVSSARKQIIRFYK